MKFSEQWLREWVDPPIDTERLVAQLTTAGLEVDGVESASGEFRGVVVARVVEAEPHPNADRLRVCTVDFGATDTIEVVCGAENARAGLFAPFAPAGARVAGGKKIRASKIRGVQSNGMLCSPIELGLGDDGDGLLELGSQLHPGEELTTALGLDDTVIDVDLTPNRGDCLGLIGIAREVGVMNRCAVRDATVAPVEATIGDTLAVTLDAPEQCPKYVGRVIRGIDPSVASPVWLAERLRRSGVRSISPVVDVTNLVMLEYGQPLHAFDLDTLHGGVVVRKARASEKLELLDGQELTLDDDILVIADTKKAVALAGIMGGGATAVTSSTTNLFLEGAYFEPRHVAGDARRFGLHTDASHRFERGVDPDNQARAIERASELLLAIVGGQAGPLTTAVADEQLPKRPPVRLRRSRLARVLGVHIDDNTVTDILGRLELNVTATEDGWQVRPPGFRFDIEIEAPADMLFPKKRSSKPTHTETPGLRSVSSRRATIPEARKTVVRRLSTKDVYLGYRDELTGILFDINENGLGLELDRRYPGNTERRSVTRIIHWSIELLFGHPGD